MGRLTTHVLDTAQGCPAEGLTIEVYRVEGANRTLLRTVTTNSDGRVGGPVLEGDAFTCGIYELVFHAGAYLNVDDNAFLNIIPIRFGIANDDQHYHVPLLLSPFGYSTYRGS